MNGTLKALVTGGLVVVAMIAASHAASADIGRIDVEAQYEQAMWYFLPQLSRWATDVEQTSAGAEVKPELAVELADLAYRGEYMLYDLEGTPVPASIKDAHERLLAGLRQYLEVAQIAADDPAGAQYLIDTYSPMFDSAHHDIRVWLVARTGIADPVVVPALAAGN